MMSESTGTWKAFAKSPHHAWLGVLTLGAGFATGEPLCLIAGATAYVLGWVYLPGSRLFTQWLAARREAAVAAESESELQAFLRRRQEILDGLNPSLRARYDELAVICRAIESASHDPHSPASQSLSDPRLRKLDELMWMYLRLLSLEQSLQTFLESERRERLPALSEEASREISSLEKDLAALETGKAPANLIESKRRLLASKQDRFNVLQKRLERLAQTQANLALVISEQDRIVQQIKLIRADAVATKNASTLSARIDSSFEHLDQTSRWLAEIEQFRDMSTHIPVAAERIGYETGKPPVIEQPASRRPRRRQAAGQ